MSVFAISMSGDSMDVQRNTKTRELQCFFCLVFFFTNQRGVFAYSCGSEVLSCGKASCAASYRLMSKHD